MRRIGVLALQGAVSEHLSMLERAGVAGAPVRRPLDLEGCDGLIIPGGESTAISRLIRQNGLFGPIRRFAGERCVMGTCAGLVLCGTEVSGTGGAMPGETGADGEGAATLEPLGIMDIAVSRNGFGRQVDSFEAPLDIKGIGRDVPAVFIRAPYIERAGKGVTVLATCKGKIVAAENRTVLVTAFHPELTDDLRILRYFCSKMV
ncbi:Glutamine amidotransferase subunit PdxT [uncultured delta proteobacterium]|uniref:Pyridoxal 5'-phosphate synthase subunit PdxT n=1 Tax=uncultured delta proteobacterium TaxID=34034 RepID=A0A212JUC9_9DELT|nr:Glutamine amidotransferase subunit PdxT [uncultured delta proteobacterium]